MIILKLSISIATIIILNWAMYGSNPDIPLDTFIHLEITGSGIFTIISIVVDLIRKKNPLS